MSRHELSPLPGCEGYEIAVGWDWPMNTFFAIVKTKAAPVEGDGYVLWLGADERIHDHETVIDAVRPYAQIPETLAFDLYGEAHG